MFFQFQNLQASKGVVHGVTQKSQQPYKGSLALHTQEKKDVIVANRKQIQAHIEAFASRPFDFVMAQQTHSSRVVAIEEEGTLGWESHEDAIVSCDALISNKKGLILGILTADCVPILLYDRRHHAIGAVHAGWRGSAEEIVLKTVQAMQERYGSVAKEIVAGVAPSIGKCCYEVDEVVAKHFFSTPHAMERVGEKYWLDLPHINKHQLLKAGLRERHIELSQRCTSCDVEHFFSYRKEQGCSGRFMSFIGLT
jgi:hypothetical protein